MTKSTNAVNHELSEITLKLFGDYPERFRQYLSERNRAECTITGSLRYVSVLAGRMEVEGIPIQALDEAKAVELIARTGLVPKSKTYCTFIARRFVRFLNEHGVGKLPLPPTAKELARAELRQEFKGKFPGFLDIWEMSSDRLAITEGDGPDRVSQQFVILKNEVMPD